MSPNKSPPPQETEDVDLWNNEDAAELVRPSGHAAYDIAISARDWTVETIVQQVRQGNIDLDPAFQRRNAWRDNRRSCLIESFILNFPVPQIVLAENPRKKKSYIVIDGKQRLMTIAGFFLDEYRGYWKEEKFSGLDILKDLNDVDFKTFSSSSKFSQYRRQLGNADIRAAVISGFNDEGVLYDIFYRINTGSVPLSSQELRQVLNRGDFSRYLLDVTSKDNAIWRLLGILEPDARLRDVELLLRLVAWTEFSGIYAGSMKRFLDDTMEKLNSHWSKKEKHIQSVCKQILLAVDAVNEIFGENAGRKYKDGRYEKALNRALLEVQALYLTQPSIRDAALHKKSGIRTAFEKLSSRQVFLSSIESTTKSLENTRERFDSVHNLLETTLKVKVQKLSIGQSK